MARIRRAPNDIERIDLGDGDWVVLRHLNFADRRAMEGALLKARVVDGQIIQASEEDVDNEAANVIMLQRAIVAWGGPGFECTCGHDGRVERNAIAGSHASGCTVWPTDVAHMRDLDETGDRIMVIIGNRRDGSRLAGDPKVSLAPSSPPLSDAVTDADPSHPISTSSS
jgi:hypothetical protein